MRQVLSQPLPGPTKIVYLFGAGATQAVLTNLDPNLKSRLLVRDVSSRVVRRAREKKKYLSDLETVTGKTGSLNIELLITLIENSKVRDWEYKTRLLKALIKADIKRILTRARATQFYLHKALLEYHEQPSIKRREELLGLISLNYDGVLDQAYVEIFRRPTNYCLWLDSRSPRSRKVPLLKLHGSFNWSRIRIRDRLRTVEIIPMGLE